MKTKLAFSAIVVFVVSFAHAGINSFSIGDTDINIPTPPDYQLVTPDMEKLWRIHQLSVSSVHEFVAGYVEQKFLQKLRVTATGKLIHQDRWFVVKVDKQLKHRSFTTQQSRGMKKTAKEIVEKWNKSVPAKVREEVRKVEKNIGNVDIDVGSIMFLEPHYEADHAVGTSFLMNVSDPTGQRNLAGTQILANVAGKILNIYVYGQRDDLQWTRAAARSWTESILANNPPPSNANAITKFFNGALDKAWAGGLVGLGTALLIVPFVILFPICSRWLKRRRHVGIQLSKDDLPKNQS